LTIAVTINCAPVFVDAVVASQNLTADHPDRH
jgi:hypothetical protein